MSSFWVAAIDASLGGAIMVEVVVRLIFLHVEAVVEVAREAE